MLGTENVAVGIRAIHMCMSIRGVEDSDAWTQTTKLGGVFKTNAETRAEFLRMLP
jgi:GTP cyclohydrolase I